MQHPRGEEGLPGGSTSINNEPRTRGGKDDMDENETGHIEPFEGDT